MKKDVVKIIKLARKQVRGKKAVLTEIGEKTSDPFKVLISCILSLRTRDAVTEKASERLFSIANNPYDMMKLRTEKIRSAIYPVSFYKTKAQRIKNMCKEIVEKYDGKVPESMDKLLEFKGVGRKTANIVVVYGFGKPAMPVDTHVHRITNRLGIAETRNAEETEQALRKRVPRRFWMDFNDIFVTFGQNVCLPRKPKCGECLLTRYCEYYKDQKKVAKSK